MIETCWYDTEEHRHNVCTLDFISRLTALFFLENVPTKRLSPKVSTSHFEKSEPI